MYHRINVVRRPAELIVVQKPAKTAENHDRGYLLNLQSDLFPKKPQWKPKTHRKAKASPMTERPFLVDPRESTLSATLVRHRQSVQAYQAYRHDWPDAGI